MSDTRDCFRSARRFVFQRARPIDCARWNFLFGSGSPEAVLDVLSNYQNSDGGFGHGLEPDFWNPNSSPMQTWGATEIVHSLGYKNSDHPVIRGILNFLNSSAHFDGHTWSRTISSNDDYPHAEWWSHPSQDEQTSERTYNPTAALAGFALQFGKAGSRLHDIAVQVSAEAFRSLLSANTVEVHELSCFHRLLQCVVNQKTEIGIDISEVDRVIFEQSNSAITRDTSKWATEYVVRPSRFIRSRADRLFPINEDLMRHECSLLRESQLEDGSWPVTWHWSSYPNEWPVAQEWWKSFVVIENIQFLKNMGEF